jgi:hypothetical protein
MFCAVMTTEKTETCAVVFEKIWKFKQVLNAATTCCMLFYTC